MPLTQRQQHTKTYNSLKTCITTIPETQLMKITFYQRNKLIQVKLLLIIWDP